MKRALVLLTMIFSCQVAALTKQQNIFRTHYKKALNGDESAVKQGQKLLAGYSLQHYLEFAYLKSQMPTLPISRIESFKQKHTKSPLNNQLDNMLVYELGKQKKWRQYLKYFKTKNSSSKKLYCYYLNARINTGDTKNIEFAIKNTWLTAASVAKECDPVFAWYKKKGFINDALIKERIKLSFEVKNASLTKYLLRKLKSQPDWAKNAISLLENPLDSLKNSLNWKNNQDNKFLALTTAKSMAVKNPKEMYSLWPLLKKHFQVSKEQAATMERRIALFAATDYLPFTIKAMNALPKDKHDSQINAWKTRYYLHHKQWSQVIKTIQKMPDFQLKKESWQYWLARAYAKTNQPGSAKRIFAKLSKKTSYHGFLSADHLGKNYSICSADIKAEPIKNFPIELDRAFELFELNMINQARKEWSIAYKKLSNPERRTLADLAFQKGWYNKSRAITGALRLYNTYKVRYPLGYKEEITKLANQYNVSPQWVMSVITQESAWQPDAVSVADARGLMQVIDETAKRLSKDLGLSYSGKQQLHNANFNLNLGIYYQSKLQKEFFNHHLLVLAAYNAGETKANDWLVGFSKSPDIWAETIPYRETRDYFKKILVNMTIYDWLINETPQRISSWMPTMPIEGADMKPWPNSQTNTTTIVECK